jgi:hypothetical protein
MPNTCWERVDTGRYATELHGHILQALRRDGPLDPTERPYVAVVDRVPVGIGAWSLAQAKTQAIQYVERQNGKAKSRTQQSLADESLFRKNGKPQPEIIIETLPELLPELVPEFEPEPLPEPPQPEPQPEQKVLETSDQASLGRYLGTPGQLAITGSLNDGDLLNTLNALRSALELLREHADLDCTVNLPPILKL